MSVDYGTSSKLPPLFHLRNEIVDPLGVLQWSNDVLYGGDRYVVDLLKENHEKDLWTIKAQCRVENTIHL
ncbi:hypothetical protein TNCV_2118821 [Trichonephila clavipes]|nr:hypothetical protein TNCV_2118821 [Trichonephila clavipes]